jgi:hypothetical protein
MPYSDHQTVMNMTKGDCVDCITNHEPSSVKAAVTSDTWNT